jgi:hypothetical protein
MTTNPAKATESDEMLLAFDAWSRSGEGRTISRIVYHNGRMTSVDAMTVFEAGWKAREKARGGCHV